MTKTLRHGEDMPMKNNDLNNLLVVAKDAVADIPEGWKENKPYYVVIPSDGSGAQVHEFKQRPVEVLIQKGLPSNTTHRLIETFIQALPRSLYPLVGMIQLTASVIDTDEWTLDVIINTPTEIRGAWINLPKVETEIPPESITILREFISKLTRDTNPLNANPTDEECAITLVYRDAPIMAGWYRPNFNFKI